MKEMRINKCANGFMIYNYDTGHCGTDFKKTYVAEDLDALVAIVTKLMKRGDEE